MAASALPGRRQGGDLVGRAFVGGPDGAEFPVEVGFLPVVADAFIVVLRAHDRLVERLQVVQGSASSARRSASRLSASAVR